MSSKNTLQEYLIKLGAAPLYTTVKAGGPDHNPDFKSTVTVTIDDKKLSASAIGKNKKEAELSAAQNLYSILTMDDSSSSVETVDDEERTIVITTKKHAVPGAVIVDGKILMAAKVGEIYKKYDKIIIIGQEYEAVAKKLNDAYGNVICKKD